MLENGTDEKYLFDKRRKLVDELSQGGYVSDRITDSRILTALLSIPRHSFVPKDLRIQAYANSPLPIGFGQTISQPYIIADMLEKLNLKGDEISLEIGTGSGYQTALMCELTKFVFSVERIKELAARAERALIECSYENFEIKVGDGSIGWEAKAPFDAIIVSAEMPEFPKSLFNQLSEGGRLVAPVTKDRGTCVMTATKVDGEPEIKWGTPCRFVPLIGEEGFPD